MRWRLGLALLLIVVMVAALELGGASVAERSRDRARTPVVGDLWTVDVHLWKRVPAGTSLLQYGRVKVTGLAGADALEVHACDSTADQRETIEDGCTEFPIALPPVARADLVPMVEDGRIVAIGTSGDPWRALRYAVIVACALGLIAVGWATWRFERAARVRARRRAL